MAKFYLLNAIALAGTNYRPGDLLDDGLDAVANVRAAGGVLWPSTDAIVVAAAALALKRRRSGASDDAIGLLMSSAALASTAAAASGNFAYNAGTDTATIALTAGIAASFAPTACSVGRVAKVKTDDAAGAVFLTAAVLEFEKEQVAPVFGQVQAAAGAGQPCTWRPQRGATPGTDLSGAGQIDLGTPAGGASAKFSLLQAGVSFFDALFVSSGSNCSTSTGGSYSLSAGNAISFESLGDFANSAYGGNYTIESGGRVATFRSDPAANLRFWDNGVAGDTGAGVHVAFIANCTVVPTTNPVAGVILYIEAGVLKYRDPAGVVHVLV